MGSAASIDRARQEAAVRGELEGVIRARDSFIARGLSLGKLPAALIAQMGASKMVDVSLNNFETLPSSLCTLAELKVLVSHTNAIRSLPRSFNQLWSLTVLDLSNNKLAELPTKMPLKLEYLRVQQNELKQIPEGIGA